MYSYLNSVLLSKTMYGDAEHKGVCGLRTYMTIRTTLNRGTIRTTITLDTDICIIEHDFNVALRRYDVYVLI